MLLFVIGWRNAFAIPYRVDSPAELSGQAGKVRLSQINCYYFSNVFKAACHTSDTALNSHYFMAISLPLPFCVSFLLNSGVHRSFILQELKPSVIVPSSLLRDCKSTSV
jgi:hypothetical protein